MLIDFFKSCIPVLVNEQSDYKDILSELEDNSDMFIAMMPSICLDLWPVFVFECTEAMKYKTHRNESLYIVPIGQHDYWCLHELEKFIKNWYFNDTIENSPNYYGADLDETILLYSDDLQSERAIIIEDKTINAMYCRISFENGASANIIFLFDKMLSVWKQVVEKHSIATDCIVDSHKGMGEWFEDTSLYKYMKKDANKDLLPPLYFKGKFISTNAPIGFEKIYDVPESGNHGCVSKIFLTHW